ncbi:MAG: cryptochrome/photolyase family protein [Oceanospirillaceae bacterium]|nr:cryptochrome/photolyase family protein [Oceanospirillaceae bacterium]
MRLGMVLGDQLSDSLPTLSALDPATDIILMAEVHQEASYVPHHPQKIALIFSAMRHFALSLKEQGWRVIYHSLDKHESPSLLASVQAVCQQETIHDVVVTRCGEYRLHQHMLSWPQLLGLPVCILEDSRFLCSPAEFEQWAQGKASVRMEFFYREMRRRTGLLMEGDQPVGGQWNFDADNRLKYKGQVPLPPPYQLNRDSIDADVVALVADRFASNPGSLDSFHWATTRAGARERLDFFIQHCLPNFGDYQDALVAGEPTLFHSLISPYLNCGLLEPMEVCLAAETAWYQKLAPLNAVEGFIRQIIGWREFVRGIYWLKMPDYADSNFFDHQQPLPGFFWDGETRMRCLSESINSALDHAYSHHIQRLMVIGNFATLAGLAPKLVEEWFLAIYADAYEWVELPNVAGMGLFADGGYLASKPYIASGNYINKMSDYCKQCHYQVKTADQSDSCPLNSLYWDFVARHRERLAGNHRMAMVYRNLDRQDPDKQRRIFARARLLIESLDDV